MNRIHNLLEGLLQVEKELEVLSSEYAELYKEYAGEEFSGQNKLAEDKLDNLILAVTHETATEIGFYRQRIIELTNFISFRKTLKNFTDEDLEKLIDNPSLPSTEKLQLQKKTTKSIVVEIEQIKSSWNMLFNNSSYAKIKRVVPIVSLKQELFLNVQV